jgi:uncharacterized RDD family membrane protein YckC
MTQWYYSDYERNRHGPVSAGDLAELHRAGQLAAETLVWHEGLVQWRPWREVMAQALAEAEGRTLPAQEAVPLSAGVNPYAMAEPVAAATATATTTAEQVAPLSSGVNPYAIAEPRAPAAAAAAAAATDPYSPYSPPRAPVHGGGAYGYVAGGEVVQAGFLKRLAAATIDNLVILVVVMMALAIAAVLGMGVTSLFSGDPTGMGVGVIFLVYVLPIVGQFVYFTWMHASPYQATLGKMAVGIKVVDTDGERISTARSLGRFAGRFFFYLFSCGLTDLVSAFTSGLTDRKQALHDMAASTLVVDRWAYTSHPERQRQELGGVTVAILALLALLIVGYVILVIALAVGAASMNN